MSKIDDILLEAKRRLQDKPEGITAIELADAIHIDRTSVSRYLNQLSREGRIEKIDGRPVVFRLIGGSEMSSSLETYSVDQPEERASRYVPNELVEKKALDLIIGAYDTLQVAVQQAKAAILYPPRGLHTLILGETGVGKSMFAELMYRFAVDAGVITQSAPFIKFNCADYAENPQLLVSQIFGVKKGAYTGAEKDRDGLLKKADQGILFLDEVHRLSPQGQEMLFTFIDKGHFRRLGDSEQMLSAEVQIIAATTEDPGSFLLKTFTRRIPMAITLPPLRERTLNERYELIKVFIKEESKRVSKAIYVNRSALVNMLLYECPNNIGQLRSDIQLACAKAFLHYKSKQKNYMMVNNSDLPQHMKKGFMDHKSRRDAVDQLLKNHDEILKFSFDEAEDELLEYTQPDEPYFYDLIEKKLEALRSSGVEEDEIKHIMNIDIEKHFQKYLGNLPERFKRDEIEKVVSPEVLDAVDYILSNASEKLGRRYDDKLYFGLALHLHSSIERIRSGGRIYHPKLNVIRVTYSDEFLIAMEMAKYIDQHFNIEVSLDEIGYLTMFLASHPYELSDDEHQRVGVVVMMHGNSTATSMAGVANSLVGEEHCVALDMPLSMKASDMYEAAKTIVSEENRGRGVILLVDMGSLANFSEMLSEETGIVVRSIDMVSTPTVIEATRKAVMGRDLFEIYNSCLEDRKMIQPKIVRQNEKSRMIITACFTGEGASEKLRAVIERDIEGQGIIEVRPLNVLGKTEFASSVHKLSEEYVILAVVSTVPLQLEGIPFISAVDYFGGKGKTVLLECIEADTSIRNISLSLTEHIKHWHAEALVLFNQRMIQELKHIFQVEIPNEVAVGMLLHLCFLVDRRLAGEPAIKFEDLETFFEAHQESFVKLKPIMRRIEAQFDISIEKDEHAHIIRMILENS